MATGRNKAGENKSLNRMDPRPALALEEALEVLVRHKLLTSEQGADIVARRATLRSTVLKEKIGSVRSQAAARYTVTPAELVTAAALPHPENPKRRVGEDDVAQAFAAESGLEYRKIDPLKVDNDLVAKTFSRPFARHHAVIPLGYDGNATLIALTDPLDTGLRESLENTLQVELAYVVASKCDILSIIDRVYGFRTKVSEAEKELGESTQGGGALVQLVEISYNEELAYSSDEHVVAAFDYLLNFAF